MRIDYRTGGYRDWRRLARLIREGFPELAEGMVSAYCREHPGRIDLAYCNRELIGATIGSPRPAIDTFWLELIAVSASARGCGVGRALLERFEERAAREGYGRVALVTRPWNTAARQLYDKSGYRTIASGPREVELEKKLPQRRTRRSNGVETSRLRRWFDRVAYRGLVTLPDSGSLFFPTRGTVRTAGGRASLVTAERRAELPAEPMRVRHQLAQHPLFAEPRIRDTIRRMPAEDVEIRLMPTVDDRRGFERPERIRDVDGLRALELLAERPLWINLHHIERYDEDYRELLAAYLRDLAAHIDEIDPEVYEAGCFLLLSSGRTSVHFHADPDQSFLNQIRGSKRAFVYPAAIVPEPAIETLAHSGDHDVVTWSPEYEAHAWPPAHLSPGDGVLLPLYAPHRVENDDAVSVSLSIGFHTRHSIARSRVHLVNRALRTLDWPVTPWGQNAFGDLLKARAHAGLRIKDKLVS